ncbi:MAG TPA: hypothetical protein VH325_07220 [Bryobacteraceae bacterium]|nr:hypothetical protein [Bryobacteraceae bacterium]
MATKRKKQLPQGSLRFASRIWHWRAKKYLYAKDYNIKGFPIRKSPSIKH